MKAKRIVAFGNPLLDVTLELKSDSMFKECGIKEGDALLATE